MDGEVGYVLFNLTTEVILFVLIINLKEHYQNSIMKKSKDFYKVKELTVYSGGLIHLLLATWAECGRDRLDLLVIYCRPL